MPWFKTGATHYNVNLGLSNKGCVIKGFGVCKSWNLEPLDLLNGLALGCYQPSLGYESLYKVKYKWNETYTKCIII